MFRPEIDDEIEEMLDDVIDESVTVPLSASDLSFNQKVRIVVEALYGEVQRRENPQLVIDRYYLEEADGPDFPNPNS